MIGSTTTTQSFKDTLRYVARETAQQIFSTLVSGFDGEVDEIAAAMEQEAQWSDRVENPCYHFSLSPAPDDELSESDWYNLSQDFLEEMELDNRQAVGWLHHDAYYPDGSERTHLHLIVNRVDAVAGAASTSWDYRRVDEVIRGLEKSYQLSSVDPAKEVEVRNDSWGQVERFKRQQAEYETPDHPRDEPPEPSIKGQLQDALDEAMVQSTSIDEIPEYLEQQGIETRQNSFGWSFGKGEVHFAGSQLGKRYARSAVERTMSEENSLSMREVMQQTGSTPDAGEATQAEPGEAEADELEAEAARSRENQHPEHRGQKPQVRHQRMRQSGQRLMERTQDVDGLTFIGAGMATAGTLAERFNQQLDAARESSPSNSQQEQLKQLEDIGNRAEVLESKLEPEASEIASNDNEGTQSALEKSVGIADERVKRLEQQFGIESEPGEKGHVDDAIAQLDQRLGQVEEAAQQRSQPEVTTVSSQVQALDQNSGAKTAESLENFTLARTQFKGHLEPQPYRSSIGTVEMTREGFQERDTRLTVTDEDFGTVFEAKKDGLSGQWDTEIDELNQQETETVARLPQSAQAYGQYKRGQSLVKTLQQMPQTSQQFKGERGEINWSGEGDEGQDFSYTLGIETQEDGSQRVTGQDVASGDPVFSATIQPQENQVFVEQNDIPEYHSQQILDQREREVDPPELERKELTLGAQSQRSRQRELEL